MNTYKVAMKFANGEISTKTVMALDWEDAQDMAIDACEEIGVPSGEIVSIRKVTA